MHIRYAHYDYIRTDCTCDFSLGSYWSVVLSLFTVHTTWMLRLKMKPASV